jgi:sulfur-oxidizing protein SoxX
MKILPPPWGRAGERVAIALAIPALLLLCACTTPSPRDVIATPFAASADPAHGRDLFISREGGHCVLCHAAPGIAPAGNVGPSLAGVGSRLTSGQIRLRVADITRVKPQAAMPAFHRTEGLARVAPEYRGRPALSGAQVEDLVAWLATLR